MLKEIEIRLIDENGNTSKAFVDYKGYVRMLKEHDINMVNDTLKALITDYEQSRTKKDPIAEHEKFRAPHKH
jgi:hypothetical protein